MIIVKLIGGIGNQMFQYATGRNVAYRLGTELKLDVSGFKNYKLRKYELGAFNISENFANTHEIQAIRSKDNGFLNKQARCLLRDSRRVSPRHILEKHFHFDPKILALPDNIYLDGYWQSENYFKEIAHIIRDEFTVKTPQQNKNKELADLVTSSESVSLHIRRGDYVNDPKINQRYGTCGMAYYFRSIEHLSAVTKTPHFFIFSDDPKWAYDNLKIHHAVTFVDHNDANKNYEDLRLMSQCKHNIIANSSFSWWGAWLNNNINKLVCAPKRWLKDTTAADDYNDFIDNLLPPEWTRI